MPRRVTPELFQFEFSHFNEKARWAFDWKHDQELPRGWRGKIDGRVVSDNLFPFDFSGYQFNWEPLARFVIVLTMVAVGISIVVETAKLVRSATSHPE